MVAEQGVCTGEEARRRHGHPFALHGFDEEGRDVTAAQFALECREVTERDRGVRKQGAEPLSELSCPVDGQRSRGQSVERMAAVDDALAARGVAREL